MYCYCLPQPIDFNWELLDSVDSFINKIKLKFVIDYDCIDNIEYLREVNSECVKELKIFKEYLMKAESHFNSSQKWQSYSDSRKVIILQPLQIANDDFVEINTDYSFLFKAESKGNTFLYTECKPELIKNFVTNEEVI